MVAVVEEAAEEAEDQGRIVRDSDQTTMRRTRSRLLNEMLATCWARIGEHEDRMLARLDAGERATLLALLARVGAAGE